MAEFHAGSGYSFERLDDGSVKVRCPEHDGRTELPEVVFDAATWASVVASVTPAGRAMTGRPNPPRRITRGLRFNPPPPATFWRWAWWFFTGRAAR